MHDDNAFSVDAFVTLPRVSGLVLSPDGRRLVTTVATPAPDGKRFRSALYALDPRGEAEPRRLTRSTAGETSPAFLPNGDLLFTSPRPDPERSEPSDETSGLWVLPPEGEARLVADPPGGVTAATVARQAGTVAIATRLHPGAAGWDDDAERDKARKDAGVTAQLFDSFPVRYWDHWYGPRQTRLYASLHADGEWTALTSDPGYDLERTNFDVTPDGTAVVATRWQDAPDPRDRVTDLVVLPFDGGSAGTPRVLVSDGRVHHDTPACSPDGSQVVCVRETHGSPDEPVDETLVVVPFDGSAAPRDLLPDFDRWPRNPVWAPDGQSVYFTADDQGHCLPFRVDVRTATVRRLAAWGAFDSLVPSPDGATVYAVRSSIAESPHVVALDADATDQEPRRIPTPGDDVSAPGRVERVEATADDGATIPGWLVLPPDGDGPAPLAVAIHGGPLGSWNAWNWRWCPHLLAAQGWAVLLPDPALSTGYGLDYIRRGWGRWGAEPYTDILRIVDAVEARPDIDAERTAAVGGSFGGYMANWIAGHTDRFDAIVTHASLWNLEAFHGTTDFGPWWENEFGDRYRSPERYREWSPHQFVDRITTPMLVIHGEKDFRVPVSEGVSLWTDLKRHGVEAMYLHYPDENHWILTPRHSALWYQTVFAFLDHHVLGKPWEPPELLR
jgi:dipeptidyl aminopeptidase/acylaminoacyl peptidase